MEKLFLTAISIAVGALAAACHRAAAEATTTVTAADAGSTLVAVARPASVAAPPQATGASACGEGMLLVSGEYCPEVEHRCLEWLDPKGTRYEHFRCARYAKPATCKSKSKRAMRFCIEATEHTERGSELPVNGASWTEASRVCSAMGARLCTAAEWQFACEGEEMRPYPYGWERDPTACNVDIMSGLGKVGRLVDHRAPASRHPRCLSPFGVHGMAGNVDEWVTIESLPRGSREVMKGSWWIPGKHVCRAQQAGHGAHYGGTESGIRCCKDASSG